MSLPSSFTYCQARLKLKESDLENILAHKAADKADVPVRLISFKASVQALWQWESLLKPELSTYEQARLLSLLCDSIAASA